MTNLAEKINFRSKKAVVKKTEVSNSLISPIALAALGLFGAIEVRAAQSIEPVTDRAELLGAARAAFEAGGVAPERIEALMQLLASAPLDQLESLVTKSLAAVAASFEQIPIETAVSADDLIQTVMQQAAVSLEAGELDLSPLPAMVSKVDGFDNTEPQQMLDRIEGLSDAIAGAFNTGRAEGQGADAFMQLLAVADTGTKSDSTPSTGAETAATATAAATSSTSIGLLLLAAAAGGGGGGGGAAAAASSSGAVVKGPLSGAFVFRDANGNYQFDAGEESTTTAADGTYTLSGSGGTVIATNPDGGAATDTFSNASFSGVLAAPSNASVVTPLTTLLAADPTLTVAKLQEVLGLDGVDVLTFNPFGAGVSDADKLKVEKVAVQVQEVLVSMGGAVSDSGISLGASVKSVAKSLGETLGASAAGASVSATLSSALDATIAKVVAANPTVKTAVLNVAKASINTAVSNIESATDLTVLASSAKSSADALASKAAASKFTVDDFTIALDATEDVATGGGGAAEGPSVSVENASRAKLLDYFDGVGALPAAAPKITIDLTGFTFSGDGTLDLEASLSKDGLSEDLSVVVTGLSVTTDGELALEANQTAEVSLKFGDVVLASFELPNADKLLVTDGNAIKIDFEAFTDQINDNVLDTTQLSAAQVVTLGKVVLGAVLQSTTTDSLVSALKAAVTLPDGADTVGELTSLLTGLLDLPGVGTLTLAQLVDVISDTDMQDAIVPYLEAMGFAEDDTLSDAVGIIGDSQFADWSPSQALAGIVEIGRAAGFGLADVNALFDDVANFLIDSASEAGVSRQEIVDAVLGSINDGQLSQVKSLLEGIDLQGLLGADLDLVDVATQFISDQTIDLGKLVPVIAKLAFATDGKIDFTVNNFDGVSVTNGDSPVTGFTFSVPVGNSDTPEVTSTLEGAGGLTVPAGTFTGSIAAYSLSYGSLNDDDEFVAVADLPDWVEFDESTGAISGTPLNEDVGTHYFILTAYTESGTVTKKPFTLTIAEANDAPTAESIPDQSVVEGLTSEVIDLSQYFSDEDTTEAYNTLTYTVTSSGDVTGSVSGAELTITASIVDGTAEGSGSVTVTASDGKGGTASKVISVEVTQDTTPPEAPIATYVDNGVDETDGLTSLGAVAVSGLETNSTIEVSVDGGDTWADQTLVDGSFTLATGVYADDVLVRAVDAAGNASEGTELGIGEVVEAPATPSLTLGAAIVGAVTVGNLPDTFTGTLAGWQYSYDGGENWSETQQTVGGEATFTVDDGTYAAGDIQVRSVNSAGFTSEAAESDASWLVDTVAPTITSLSTGVLSGDTVTYEMTFSEPVQGLDADDFTVGSGVTKTSIALKTGTESTYELVLTVGARAASDIAADIASGVSITDDVGNAFVLADLDESITSEPYLIGKTGAGLTSLNSSADAETFIFGSTTTDTLVIDAATDSTESATDKINGFVSGTDKIDISSLLSDYSGLSTKTYSSAAELYFTIETIALDEEGAVTTNSAAAVSYALKAKVYTKNGLFAGETGSATEGLIAFTLADTTGIGEMSVALSTAVFKGTPVTLVDGSLVSMGAEYVKEVSASGYLGAITITPSAGTSQSEVAAFADSFELMLDTLSITLGADTSTETLLPLPVSIDNPTGRSVAAVAGYYTVGDAGDNAVSVASTDGITTIVYDDNPDVGTYEPITLMIESYGTNGETAVNLTSTDFIFSS